MTWKFLLCRGYTLQTEFMVKQETLCSAALHETRKKCILIYKSVSFLSIDVI